MLVKVVHKNVRVSPKKAILVCRLLQGKSLTEAYRILSSINEKKSVKLLRKILLEASANAVNNYAMRGDNLQIQECVANKGIILKRTFYRAKGRTDLRLKRWSHISVTLREGEQVKRSKESSKKHEGKELSTKKAESKSSEE
ncbi:50S ribosomal protein L22 [Mycoplasma suis]|uniref:50S ribosomal protein L22 n=1 Tax=Mycoplasma suis (strain Illinois) TaxID=768700 RepID=F0QR41_MYCSL|nr:50S ribosomal protein L22 [Mycoplasma suis]ADX97961.1 50S ribosomal protein L22/unknown domain fusion protein [Mycoplasma suis str. Illinois]